MPDEIQHRLSTEGADPLLLAGVNDANLTELQRATGVRATLRGDTLTLGGSMDQVERATPVVQGMLDLARMGETVTPEDVARLVAAGPSAEPVGPADTKIILPGLRRIIAAKTPGQREYLQAIGTNDVVVGVGPAGTGKTYLAVAKAVEALARKRVRRIVLARPAVEAGESLGFLDEAQNATGAQMKMFLTRLGVNSKVVVTGDKTQIDLPRREDSGLVQIERILPGVDGIAFCYLDETDVVRHRLVREIIKAYAEDQHG